MKYTPPVKPDRYQNQDFSDEELARDWTLTSQDLAEIQKYRKDFRVFIAVQLCGLRLHGRFLKEAYDLSPRVIAYLNQQLHLPPSLGILVPERKATYTLYRKNILLHLGFKKLDEQTEQELCSWLEEQASQAVLPNALYQSAEHYLIRRGYLLPAPSRLKRLIGHACSQAHKEVFESIYRRLPLALRQAIDHALTAEGHRSYFSELKDYPPTATITSLKTYLKRYQKLADIDIDRVDMMLANPAFQEYGFRLTKKYSAKDIKRMNEQKRYALMMCFLFESRRKLLDHLVKMHDQYLLTISRECRNAYEKKHRAARQRHKRAIDAVLNISGLLLGFSGEEPVAALWKQVDPSDFKASVEDLRHFKDLQERGYAKLLLARYPSFRKYFADFLQLPLAAEYGNESLLYSIELLRSLDAGTIKHLPSNAPVDFVPKELRGVLYADTGKINRNAWEMGVAFAIKDAFRSGDLYLPQSKHHVSFWQLLLSQSEWEAQKEELEQPSKQEIRGVLTHSFQESVTEAVQPFEKDRFARIESDKLKLRRKDKIPIPDAVSRLQKLIDASMPKIRIEQLLAEVDRQTQFTQHFTPVQGHHPRSKLFYKSLIAALLSQATNLGVVAMSASVKDVSVDQLRHVLRFFVRDETLEAASSAIVNRHHELPLSAVYGDGSISSSDAQRFGIRASSLLASYYPRYYGYYRKAIGVYTHLSDQYSVFSTMVISCSPREALYVLDGLLENNSILQPKKHTTDTHGYTEIIFALCHLLGFEFMPRIRDLKDQQLYRIDKESDHGVFTPLLSKTANLTIVEEQWESMLRVAQSLKQRTVPAHIVVERLLCSYPADRLAKAFTNLGRVLKTQYILRYLSDSDLRNMVQRQLNKGEYRHKLPRWIFFANQGEFQTGDYEEIMNKASCLSLVSNAILYWNTIQIQDIVQGLRERGEPIDDETLSHISLLPYKHVLPNGTYFIENERGFM